MSKTPVVTPGDFVPSPIDGGVQATPLESSFQNQVNSLGQKFGKEMDLSSAVPQTQAKFKKLRIEIPDQTQTENSEPIVPQLRRSTS